MKHTSKFRSLAATLLIIGSLAGVADGALTLNISDLGGGQTRWQFSGSTTIISGGPSSANGFWFNDNNSTGFDTVGLDSGFMPVTGTWSAIVDGTTLSLFDIYIQSIYSPGDGRFGIRTSPSPQFATGDAVSWSGDLVLNIPISTFASGTFTSGVIGTTGEFQTLADDTVFIVGSAANAIPEPTSALLFGLAALGFSARRRR